MVPMMSLSLSFGLGTTVAASLSGVASKSRQSRPSRAQKIPTANPLPRLDLPSQRFSSSEFQPGHQYSACHQPHRSVIRTARQKPPEAQMGLQNGGLPGREVGKVPHYELPSKNEKNKTSQTCLIFFIPGNPGLVGYYEPFLDTLRSLLDEAEARGGNTKLYHIYSQNLLGFDDADHPRPFSAAATSSSSSSSQQPPYSLEEQISHLCSRLADLNSPVPYDKVVLMGHSVGAYMAVEVFHRYHISPFPQLNLHSAVLLFPTVTHIARSPNGRRLSRLRNTTAPLFDTLAHRVARAFLSFWPAYLLGCFLRVVWRMPSHAAAVTTRFLKSRDGIWQALYLAADEMRTITEERWREDLWEIAEGNADDEMDKFVFLFGEKDHWVADECRDAFIQKRVGHADGRVRVVMDESGIPHAFCLDHSETVANKVAGWIEDMVGR